MRRKEKLVEDRKAIDAIIGRSSVCRLAMAADGQPYLVPLSFGYDGEAIYFHTAPRGRKIDCFEADPRVCFEFEAHSEVVTHPTAACKWSLHFESVIGFGTVGELLDPDRKRYGLNRIMRHYSGKEWTFDDPSLARTRVWRITIESMTGKRSPGPSAV